MDQRIRGRTAAPVDPRRLEPVLRPFGESLTLPAEVYTSPAVFDWEMRHFFEGSWICVGRSNDLVDPGGQRALRIGDEGVLLVRGADGILRGFFNVCRHRGHEILGPGEERTARAIKCPYHAWVYGLEGELRAAPRFGDVPSFRREDFPLIEARVEEWNGWVFVNTSGDAPAFEEQIGNLGTVVDSYTPERLVVRARHDYELAANWKIVVENYLECYHCGSIHPELCHVSPPESDQDFPEKASGAWSGGPLDLREHAETMSLSGESKGVPIPGLPDRLRRQVGYAAVLPNLLVSVHPDYVMTHRLEPLDPGHTRVECLWMFPPEAFDRPDFDPAYAADFWDVTNREDWEACESVQRAVASRGHRQGPMSTWEVSVYEAMAMIARGYLEGVITPLAERAPAPGPVAG